MWLSDSNGAGAFLRARCDDLFVGRVAFRVCRIIAWNDRCVVGWLKCIVACEVEVLH